MVRQNKKSDASEKTKMEKIMSSKLMSIVSTILQSEGISAQATLTSAEKNYVLTCEVREIYENEGEHNLLNQISSVVASFPAGKIEKKKLDPVTGKEKVTKIEYRDGAKKCFVNAFKNSREALGFTDNHSLKFKLCQARIDHTVAQVASLEEKIAKVVGDDLDRLGLTAVMVLLNKEIDRTKLAQAELASRFSVDQELAEMTALCDVWKNAGVTASMAEQIAREKFSGLNDVQIADTLEANM